MTSVKRCTWACHDEAEKKYHDEQWGVPIHDDDLWFEFLTLEGAQAGLSWRTIINKRAGYQSAFYNFDIKKVARMTDAQLDELLLDPKIIRNRLKVYSTRNNAQCMTKVQQEFGSFDSYMWQFVDNTTIVNQFKSLKNVPSSTLVSDAISKDLKKRGFKFIGTTICYALMQASGMTNDHETSCFRYEICKKLK